MSVLLKLATSLGRKDEAPNIALAKAVVSDDNKKAVKELVDHLNNKDKNIQSDCIKVLYEIARLKPELVGTFASNFVALLDNKNNRLQWGAMMALNAITNENPAIIYKALAKIIMVADTGSVITNDQCIEILIKLSALKKYSSDAYNLLLERLVSCAVNQLPMYAENALVIINNSNKAAFIKVLTSRLGDIEKDSKRLRVEKVIQKLQRTS